MKTLFLHIGHFKTGTSAIQQYLSDNAVMLEEHGYYYVRGLRSKNAQTNHSILPIHLLKKFNGTNLQTGETSFEELITQFKNEIKDIAYNNIILSSEFFYNLSVTIDGAENQAAAIDLLQKSLGFKNIKIIFFCREPLSLIKSWYKQLNKGETPSDTFIQMFYGHRLPFTCQNRALQLWREQFGESSLSVIEYHQAGNSHINSFLNSIGLPDLCNDDLSVNSSVDESTLEEKRRLKIEQTIPLDEQWEFTCSKSLIEDVNFNRLKWKLGNINDDYELLTSTCGLSKQRPISVHDIIAYGEKINAVKVRINQPTLQTRPGLLKKLLNKIR